MKELAGFAELDLAPGATGTARVNLADRCFARWDPAVHDWVVDPGSYSITMAASATGWCGALWRRDFCRLPLL